MSTPKLGVCYYPEHWPETIWPEDAKRMAALGLKIVRIGEFAWSRLEPHPGTYNFDWLSRVLDILHAQELEVILGTPTATPPKWLVDRLPDMRPVSRDGQIRNFGSRRHYCPSHQGYRTECNRIVTALAERFGAHPVITGWQVDNEYGCHDTALSFSPAACAAFRLWLGKKYSTIEALNTAWGNVFWSMEYRTFDEIDLPNQTVTEANPAHWMDFCRFSSHQIKSFNLAQAEIIRAHAPGRDIIHNFMGRITDFDHFSVGEDLDIATWDSYPLGFLEDRSDRPEEFKRRYAATGDPDFQAFHHDLYRATGKGRWGVMEQQPGPVNWAPHNPAPAPGMVRLWSLEAVAHGAEFVSYFRWRQAPFGQEQMHAGLLNPDNSDAAVIAEITALKKDLTGLPQTTKSKADIALIFDYPSSWAMSIQPQGTECDYFRIVYDFYCGLRALGQTIDILPANTKSLDGYKLVVIPGLFTWSKALIQTLKSTKSDVLIGPRSGAKTAHFSIPEARPPALPKDLLDLKITCVESLHPDRPVCVEGGHFQFWREQAEPGPNAKTSLFTHLGEPALISQNRLHYIAGWPDPTLMAQILTARLLAADLSPTPLPDGLRLRRTGPLTFATNYGPDPVDLAPFAKNATFHIGEKTLPAAGFACFST